MDKIESIIPYISDNLEENKKIILKNYNELDGIYYEDDLSLLHVFVDNIYDENKVYLAIKTLLYYGVNPNIKDWRGYNFIQLALYTGYSEEFILKIISESIKYGLDVNSTDNEKDTIMHTAIYSDNYIEEIITIYKVLCAIGFDSTLIDNQGRNLYDAMIFQTKEYKKINQDLYSDKQIKEFYQEFITHLPNNKQYQEFKNKINETNDIKRNLQVNLSKKDIDELQKNGRILNLVNYEYSPTIGREKEITSLILELSKQKSSPILVGESGIGKTAIVNELVYKIQYGLVPNFLKNKIIYQIYPNSVIAGCKYVGMFEEKLNKILEICERNGIIIFIDEIHTIYGVGATTKQNAGMDSYIKNYIEGGYNKIIGITTNNEYQEYFSNDALKRRFNKINIKEPDTNTMFIILDKVINDFSNKNNIYITEELKEQIIKIILKATDKKSRVHDDIVNNPDLSISIIDNIFAFAKLEDSTCIETSHIIDGINHCDRIYEFTKESIIRTLNYNIKENKKTKSKILTFPSKGRL